MGIKGLTKLLGDNAARCIKENELKSYFGRKYGNSVDFLGCPALSPCLPSDFRFFLLLHTTSLSL